MILYVVLGLVFIVIYIDLRRRLDKLEEEITTLQEQITTLKKGAIASPNKNSALYEVRDHSFTILEVWDNDKIPTPEVAETLLRDMLALGCAVKVSFDYDSALTVCIQKVATKDTTPIVLSVLKNHGLTWDEVF